jgi:hypothetical protein
MTTSGYDAYHCTECDGTGMRRNESPNIVDPRSTVVCFCDGMGVVLVLVGYRPPWYAGERWPERDIPASIGG